MGVVAIDGPSGVGKSSLAKEIAKRFGFCYLDTGALYRTLGYGVLIAGGKPEDQAQVEKMVMEMNVDIRFLPDGQHMFLDGEDVNDNIRSPQVSMAASDVAAVPAVRKKLLALQREAATMENVVVDGRDIGTIVFPKADLKIFLTASPQERARRRFLENKEKGGEKTVQAVLEDILQRDEKDSSRTVAPLRQAEDAILVDSTALDFEQTLELVSNLIKERFFL